MSTSSSGDDPHDQKDHETTLLYGCLPHAGDVCSVMLSPPPPSAPAVSDDGTAIIGSTPEEPVLPETVSSYLPSSSADSSPSRVPPYPCTVPGCSVTLARRFDISRHCRSAHGHDPGRFFPCPYQGMDGCTHTTPFPRKDKARDHMRTVHPGRLGGTDPETTEGQRRADTTSTTMRGAIHSPSSTRPTADLASLDPGQPGSPYESETSLSTELCPASRGLAYSQQSETTALHSEACIHGGHILGGDGYPPLSFPAETPELSRSPPGSHGNVALRRQSQVYSRQQNGFDSGSPAGASDEELNGLHQGLSESSFAPVWERPDFMDWREGW